MFAELRELLRSGAIRRHQLGSKGILTPMIHGSILRFRDLFFDPPPHFSVILRNRYLPAVQLSLQMICTQLQPAAHEPGRKSMKLLPFFSFSVANSSNPISLLLSDMCNFLLLFVFFVFKLFLFQIFHSELVIISPDRRLSGILSTIRSQLLSLFDREVLYGIYLFY